jgi:hypothetical protein
MTERYWVVAAGVAMLFLGMLMGAAWSKTDASCSNETKDGGITIIETCVREWRP